MADIHNGEVAAVQKPGRVGGQGQEAGAGSAAGETGGSAHPGPEGQI